MTLLDEGQASLAAGRWPAARDAFAQANADEESAAACEGLAQAMWWLDEADAALRYRERAYRLHRAAGDQLGAARAATALAWDCVLFGTGATVAEGWLQRAGSLLAELPEASEHGWHAVRSAELALGVDHDPALALEAAVRASAIGRRQADASLSVVGLALQGLALVEAGEIALGMPRLDEAVTAATGGDVDDLMWMGKVCCFLIAACDHTRDLGRAVEWCARVEAVCREHDMGPLFAVCRTQYASVLVARGTWPEAEHELDTVLASVRGSRRASRVEAAVQLGDLRRRQGRLDEAERLFVDAEFHPLAAVGQGELRLARGDAAGAQAVARRLLATTPATSLLARVRPLELAVRAAHATGDRPAGQAAADELQATAEAVGTEPLLASAAFAAGLLAEPEAASALLHDAVRRYAQAGLRHEAARARLALARALLATGDRPAAEQQAGQAAGELTALAAATDLREARRLLAELGRAEPPLLSPRELEVLGLVAEGHSNREIAARLVLSEHTVHRHVANVLRKLNQPSRAAAVAFAARRELV